MSLASNEKPKLTSLLNELAGAVEQILLSGLTTASDSTQKTLSVTLQEATRLKLLRFGATLRHTQDELNRYLKKDPDFGPKRLAFFLNRTWLLAKAMLRALKQNNDAEFDQLNWAATTEPVERLRVVSLGVSKKVTPAVVLFEFRLRAVSSAGPIQAGQRLLWTCLFNQKPGTNVPAEGFLVLPQKQKFKTEIFTSDRMLEITKFNVARSETGPWRISLTDVTTVLPGDACTDWSPWTEWNPDLLLDRVNKHEPGPFDLEIDLQEEVVLDGWDIGETEERREESKVVYPIAWRGVLLQAEVTATSDGKALRESLERIRKQKRRREPLFGLLHFDRCRGILQPLSLLTPQGPQFLTLSREKIDAKSLLQILKF